MRFKNMAICLAVASAISSAAMLSACGEPNDSGTIPVPDGASEYVMEAECVDLDDVVGSGISSSQSGIEMIYPDVGSNPDASNWSGGYYVGYTYNPECVITFEFESDSAATATIILRLGSELGDLTLTPDAFSVKLNGTEISYSSIYVQGSDSMAEMKFYDKAVTSTANIVAGKNTIMLSVLPNELNASAQGNKTGAPCIDCVKIQTAAKLTWTDRDNVSKRGEI